MAKDVLENSIYRNFTDSRIIKPVVGMSRDGVINYELQNIKLQSQFQPITGSIEAITSLRKAGFGIAIITNQPGISQGHITPYDVDQIHQYFLELLGQAGCQSIDAIYYSTSQNKKDYYAKPNIGMFRRCEKEFPQIDFSKGYFIGNTINDVKAAVKIGAKPILVRTGSGELTEKQLQKYTYRNLCQKTQVFDTLFDAAEYLI